MPVQKSYMVASVPDGIGWRAPDQQNALAGALTSAGFADQGLTCLAITS